MGFFLMSLHVVVIASEAKQSSFLFEPQKKLDCFVASAPRNDGFNTCATRAS
jgi:hypothetical protein